MSDIERDYVDDAIHELHTRWGEQDGDEWVALPETLVQETAEAMLRPALNDLRGAVAENERLRQALRDYGIHGEACPRHRLFPECDCGLDRAIGGQ